MNLIKYLFLKVSTTHLLKHYHRVVVTLIMAAVNHIRNRRSQRMRDVFEDLVARCLDGETVNVNHLLDMFDANNSNFEDREVAKLQTLAGIDNNISKFEQAFLF